MTSIVKDPDSVGIRPSYSFHISLHSKGARVRSWTVDLSYDEIQPSLTKPGMPDEHTPGIIRVGRKRKSAVPTPITNGHPDSYHGLSTPLEPHQKYPCHSTKSREITVDYNAHSPDDTKITFKALCTSCPEPHPYDQVLVCCECTNGTSCLNFTTKHAPAHRMIGQPWYRICSLCLDAPGVEISQPEKDRGKNPRTGTCILTPPATYPNAYPETCSYLNKTLQDLITKEEITSTEMPNYIFLTTIYTMPAHPRCPPTSELLCSLAAKVTNPTEWSQSWPLPDPYDGDITTPISNYDDRNASIEVTLRTLWTWLKEDDIRRLDIIKEAVLNFGDRPEKPSTVHTWLIPGRPSYHRGILLTHIIMSASLYGWHSPGLTGTTALLKHVVAMLIKTQEHTHGLDKAKLRTYIAKRIECICELAYVFLLFRRMETQPTMDTHMMAFIRHLAHHVAEMCQDNIPKFAPTTMPADDRAHCLTTALQMLTTTPPDSGTLDPRRPVSHTQDALLPEPTSSPHDAKNCPPPHEASEPKSEGLRPEPPTPTLGKASLSPKPTITPSTPTRAFPRRGTTRLREEPDPRRIGTRTSADTFEGCEWGNEGGPELLRGYLYQAMNNNNSPPLYLAHAEWLQDESGIIGAHTRGLFAGRDYNRLESITPYAGVVVYMDRLDETLLTKDDRSYLKTFMHKERCALNGFRSPKEGYGMAQFANDKRGEQPPNAEFIIIQTANMPGVQPRNREIGMYLRALRRIEKGEEITVTYDSGYFIDYDNMKPDPKRPKPTPPYTHGRKRAPTDEQTTQCDKRSRTNTPQPAQKHNNTPETLTTEHNNTLDTAATATTTHPTQRLHRALTSTNTHPHPHSPSTHHTHIHHTPPHPPPSEGGVEEIGMRNGGGSPSVGGSSDVPGVHAPAGLATRASPTHTAGLGWRRGAAARAMALTQRLGYAAGRVTDRLRPLRLSPPVREPGRPPPTFPPSYDGEERPLRCSGRDQNATRSPKSGAPQAAQICSQALDPPDASHGWRIGPQHPPSWWCTSCTPPHRGRDVEPCSTYGCDSLVCYLFTAAHPAEMVRLATDRQHRRCTTCITDPPGWE